MGDRSSWLKNFAFLLVSLALTTSSAWADAGEIARVVASNDNTRPAGTSVNGTARIHLVAAPGDWQPEGPRSPKLRIAAFGEDLDSLVTPAPLLRVTEGSAVIVQIANELTESLNVHGLVTRPASNDVVMTVAPGATREVRFVAGSPGTYHYWATTSGKAINLRSAFESQLGGGFIVDRRGEQPKDRVFVMSEWDDRVNRLDDNPQPGDKRVFTINGQSWPYTERLREVVGERAQWRIVNLTLVAHPMHLHGFYFDIAGESNGLKADAYAGAHMKHAVTQLLAPGSTMDMAWTPERPGNWLFHCHIVGHITPGLRFWETPGSDHTNHSVHDAKEAMTGLVMGIEVTGEATPRAASTMPTRLIALTMFKRDGFWKPEDGFGFAMGEGEIQPRAEDVRVPGPPLILVRNQPVEITLTNHLPEATAIHWHGIELESYYDGVPGFSGSSVSTTPAIEPEDSLTIRFTPPRAGTFMYHTHSHDERQLASGLYGAIVVLEPGETFDPSRDHIVLLGMQGAKDTINYQRFPVVVNGRTDVTIPFKAGVPNRVRFINITTNFGGLNVSILGNNESVSWRMVAKDGAAIAPEAQLTQPALRQQITVGETSDFIVDAPARGVLWLDVKRAGGEWVQQVRVPIVP
jgi:FtsP/CotA-like multicopper oxidase with cupredoxin domain